MDQQMPAAEAFTSNTRSALARALSKQKDQYHIQQQTLT
jgi:hypothetical protein